MATKWKRLLTDEDLTESFGNLGTGDLSQADSERKYKMGDQARLRFECNFIAGNSATSLPIIEIENNGSANRHLFLGGDQTFVGTNSGTQTDKYRLPAPNTFTNRSFVFAENSQEVKFKSSHELFNPVDGLAYDSGYASVSPVTSGSNEDSVLIHDKSNSRLSTAKISDIIGSKIFSLTFGYNSSIEPGTSQSTASANQFMRGTNGVQFEQNYGHIIPAPCKIIGGTFSFFKDIDAGATNGTANTRRRFNVWIGSVASAPGSAGDAAFPNAAYAFSSDLIGYNIAQGNYIGSYEFDYDTTLSAGDFVSVGITSYTSAGSSNGPTSQHQATLYFRYLD